MAKTETPQVSPATAPALDTKRILIKAIILLVLAVSGMVIFSTPALRQYFDKAGPIAEWFNKQGALGVVGFILGCSLVILFGFPRLLLCPIAGALYGFWMGLLVSIISSMISYYVAFIWIRGREHHGLSRAALPKQLAFLTGDPGISGVMIGRCVPAPGMLVTMALALSNVSTSSYLLGSAIGLIPEAVPFVIVGTGIMHSTKGEKLAQMFGFGCIAVVGAWALIRYLSRRKKQQ